MLKKLLMTFGTSVAIMVINIVGGIITARLLGPLGKGQLTAVTLWPGVLASVGNLGLANAIVYFTGKVNDENVKTIWSGTFVIGLVLTILLSIVGFFLLPIFMQQYSIELIMLARLYLLFIPLNIFTQFGIAIFQGRMRIVTYNIVRFLVISSYFIGVIILALLDKVSVQSCTVILLVSNAIILLFELFWLNKLGLLGINIDLSLMRQMVGYGLKSHIGNISSLLNLRMDQMVMAIILSPELLGLYVVAVTISNGVNLITGAIATITFPTISTQNMQNIKKKAFARSIRLTFWCSIFISIVLLVSVEFLINILYGKDFSPAVPAARVLIVAAIVSGMNMTLASGLKGYGKPSISSVGELISLFFTGILLWLLLPHWGILGAAIASLVAYSCNFLFMHFHIWQELSISPKVTFIPQPEDFIYIRSLISRLRQTKLYPL